MQHILRASATSLDWRRLLDRFGVNWRVLFGHLVMFGYVYPRDRERIPVWVMRTLMARLERAVDSAPPEDAVCRGTLLSRQQYLIDVTEWGYEDARVRPENPMTDDDISLWTSGISEDGSK